MSVNICNKVKIQAKILSCRGVSGKETEIRLPKDEGLWDIRHRIGEALDTRESILGVNSGCLLIAGSLWHFIRNAPSIIRKCHSNFVTKCVRFYIIKCNTLISKCGSYSKIRQFYYNMRRLIQNALLLSVRHSSAIVGIY